MPSLAALAQHHDVLAVVCQPDKPQGRSKKLMPPPVKVWAEAHDIAVHQPSKLNDGTFEAWLKAQAPEICTVAAYGRMLKQPILDVPAKGWLNVHPSLLPRHRGASPIQTAILEGDEMTGVSIMDVILEMDAGDILLQESTPIGPHETAAELSSRLAEMGARLLVEGVNMIERGDAHFMPQAPELITESRKFEKQDGAIQWQASAEVLDRQIRAANPWPIAHCMFQNKILRIHQASIVAEDTQAAPGVVTHIDKKSLWVATGRQQLSIEIIQAPGKKALPVDAFLRGNQIALGDRFEEVR